MILQATIVNLPLEWMTLAAYYWITGVQDEDVAVELHHARLGYVGK